VLKRYLQERSTKIGRYNKRKYSNTVTNFVVHYRNILRRNRQFRTLKHRINITNKLSLLSILTQRVNLPVKLRKCYNDFHAFSFTLYTLHNKHACAIPVVVTIRCNRVLSLSRCIRGMRGISINSRNQKRRSGRGCALCAPFPLPNVLLYGPTPLPHAPTDVAFLPPRRSSSWDL